MNKEILEKILKVKTPLSVSDLTADEKKQLYAELEKYGCTQSWAYVRLFQKGFDLWELLGINFIKTAFLRFIGKREDSDYLQVLQLEDEPTGWFWSVIGDGYGVRQKLKTIMGNLGMSSGITVGTRFSSDNWTPYEKVGLFFILNKISDENLNYPIQEKFDSALPVQD